MPDKQSALEAAELACGHIRVAKQVLSHVTTREASLVQTKLDEAAQWLYTMIRVELTEQSMVFLAGSNVSDLEYLTGNLSSPPTSVPLEDDSVAYLLGLTPPRQTKPSERKP